jgi:D-arabinose 1-dehydrogenase-like Zn-dependent alcohol dehydrogenase
MLHFGAINHIHAKTQSMPMKEANSALDLVRKNKAHYRIVLHT